MLDSKFMVDILKDHRQHTDVEAAVPNQDQLFI
jgi:hypothetical protein